MKKRKLFFGKVVNFKASEYLNFQELKREKVKIKADGISDVKRKEKI